ncbi:hypothetical protein AB0F57_10260 [Streptomyces tanashiensis]|uniref:hypothetical protein n=1 Tax=Streptomyces tanashiensis TaxID=67367 RepID=UPI0033E2D743
MAILVIGALLQEANDDRRLRVKPLVLKELPQPNPEGARTSPQILGALETMLEAMSSAVQSARRSGTDEATHDRRRAAATTGRSATVIKNYSWSISLLKPREPELFDALFLSVGRALLANAYEDKCQYVLRVGNLITAHQADPAMTFEEAVASVPADKLLGGTLHSLAAHAMGRTMDMDTLHKARQDRNWIAHEGASIGAIWSVDRDRILQHTVKLRAAVTDLALGDNTISQWCHGLAEPHDLPPAGWINGYPDAVDTWVFGHLRGLLPEQPSSLAGSE